MKLKPVTLFLIAAAFFSVSAEAQEARQFSVAVDPWGPGVVLDADGTTESLSGYQWLYGAIRLNIRKAYSLDMVLYDHAPDPETHDNDEWFDEMVGVNILFGPRVVRQYGPVRTFAYALIGVGSRTLYGQSLFKGAFGVGADLNVRKDSDWFIRVGVEPFATGNLSWAYLGVSTTL